VLRQIDTVLGQPSFLRQFISHHEGGKVVATWAFACRYRLESAVKAVEAEVQTGRLRMTCKVDKNGMVMTGSEPMQLQPKLDEAVRYVSSLPSSSADVGLASLMRLLHNTSQTWADLATELRAKTDMASAKVRQLGQYSGGNNGIIIVQKSSLGPILDDLSEVSEDLGMVS
jgi:hypothetical protein